MNIKIISLLLSVVVGISGFFYFVNLIKNNAELQKELDTVSLNYDRLKVIQRAQENALRDRDAAYNEARFKHTKETKRLEEALANAQATDNCVNRELPAAVVEQLRKHDSTD